MLGAAPCEQGMVQSVKGARIACLDVNLQKSKMQFGVQAPTQPPTRASPPACPPPAPCAKPPRVQRTVPAHRPLCIPAQAAAPRDIGRWSTQGRVPRLSLDPRPAACAGGAQVLVNDPKELERIREREFDITKGACGAGAPPPVARPGAAPALRSGPSFRTTCSSACTAPPHAASS